MIIMTSGPFFSGEQTSIPVFLRVSKYCRVSASPVKLGRDGQNVRVSLSSLASDSFSNIFLTACHCAHAPFRRLRPGKARKDSDKI